MRKVCIPVSMCQEICVCECICVVRREDDSGVGRTGEGFYNVEESSDRRSRRKGVGGTRDRLTLG